MASKVLRLYVKGLPWHISREELMRHFYKFGGVTDAMVIRDSYTGMPKGFGFVYFRDESCMNKALAEAKQRAADGSMWTVAKRTGVITNKKNKTGDKEEAESHLEDLPEEELHTKPISS
ncbi:uncharacterized protein LOC127871284 [Dreissena polymorpha]|uniref:RRM domain-containing protein n=1 Tax=Dreissena polymorpha TaxID=45954 RepID=A0A9D4LFB8_DREPO|nr:uncharacterized protein LOC127871284 [Dreissena polymorpha]KAH3856759.1 hypothetical protein DPMN_099353 [Dreissena polymorpha]